MAGILQVEGGVRIPNLGEVCPMGETLCNSTPHSAVAGEGIPQTKEGIPNSREVGIPTVEGTPQMVEGFLPMFQTPRGDPLSNHRGFHWTSQTWYIIEQLLHGRVTVTPIVGSP